MDPVVSGSGRAQQRGRRPNLRAVGAVIGAMALAGGVAACGSSNKSSSSSSGAAASSGSGSGGSSSGGMTKVTIAYTAPIPDQMLPLVAQQAGYFKKEGIDANIQFVEASSVLAAMVAGQVNYTVVGAPSAEIASVNGTPLQYIGQWEHVIDAKIVANKSASSIKDMDGKTIAVSSTGALSDFLVQLANAKYGISMHEVPLGQLPNQLTAYSKGSVDALSGVSPWSVAKLTSTVPGTHVVADFTTQQGYPGVGLVADQKNINPTTATKVLTALQMALGYYKTHESAVLPILEKTAELTPSEAKTAYTTTKKLFTTNLVPSLADQKNVLKGLEPTQPKAKGFDATKLLDTTYAKQAQSAAK
jgi:ABC-type nitrate/sulfonate/bicarbonate transport system substrate-binding protein